MSHTLDALVALSARIGSDTSLVQAGGGNTSLKDNGNLWIKASGMWLAHAATEDMFVPVPMSDIDEKLARRDEKFSDYATRSGTRLRPSVETTLHAVLPQRVVIHVHSTTAISWAAQRAAEHELDGRLKGLRWAWIPYIHPGIPLALRIREELASRPEVLLLANHGLVVAADDVADAGQLLAEVERRLDRPVRSSPPPEWQTLNAAAGESGWTPAQNPAVHAVATNDLSTRIASGGTMYPDHCVYLGPGAPVLDPGETANEAIRRYEARFQYTPAFLLVPGAGVLVSPKLSRAGAEMLICLNRVVERIPATAQPTYLPDDQVARLMNWDAEKYRISVAKLHN